MELYTGRGLLSGLLGGILAAKKRGILDHGSYSWGCFWGPLSGVVLCCGIQSLVMQVNRC